MAEREIPSTPTPEEAVATLQHLAEVFLQARARHRDQVTVAGEEVSAHRRAMVLVDGEGNLCGADSEAERLLGSPAAKIIGAPAVSLFGKLPVGTEVVRTRIHRPDGTEQAVWVMRSELIFKDQRCIALAVDERDPREGRTELRYQHLVEQIPAVVFTAALDGGLYDLYVSPQIEGLLGYSQAQWVADPVLWYERLHPDDRHKLDEEFARGCVTGGPFRADCRFLTRDDKIVWVHGEARLLKDARGAPVLLQGVAFDITETKRAEELVRASLREKETLLMEIHHRVKNNLQVTSSLLKLQADRIADESAQRALREGQGRIRSMALVHELLYRSKDLANVNLGEYARDLTRQLLRSHGVDPSRVRVETRLVAVPLPIDVAVPCGLILNELVSNALKHAFPDGRHGSIVIELRRGEEFDELVVRDDGVGLPAGFDALTGSTLGINLVQTLAQQIDGRLSAHSNGGTEVRLEISRKKRSQR
ncbi:MAG TPA: histidine kinase dimerization/phosphoacceptor domain -containing protein [Myxococcaceae bacterium]|nr:histidine kinase dimerization/phosphoacceptor domain -containing protein [Myxococcaceae bacterium]